MIIANEFLFMQAMLNQGIDKEKIKKLRREFKGWRIYFRSKKSEYEDIREDYKDMIKAGYTKKDAIKELTLYYDKCEGRIKEIIAEQGDLFEV